jgi:hypothetical protein
VVLGKPVAQETQSLCVLRRAQRQTQRLCNGASFADGNEVKHGKSGFG